MLVNHCMSIKYLRLDNFRNFSNIELKFTPGINVIVGENGVGKTSVLEAVYLLSTGRSFRINNLSRLINFSSDNTTVYSELEISLGNGSLVPYTVGYQRDISSERRLKLNNSSITSISEVAKIFALCCLEGNWFRALYQPPQFRRKNLDWGVFHVKHSFFESWKRYSEVVKQRNVILRTKRNIGSLPAWNIEFSKAAKDLVILRQQYFELLKPCFNYYQSVLKLDGLGINISLNSGIPGLKKNVDKNSADGLELLIQNELIDNKDRDLERGYTTIGPHRADITFKTPLGYAKDILSRGQHKMILLAYFFAQLKCINENTSKRCTVLLDDLAAELDNNALDLLYHELETLENQVIITAINKETIRGKLSRCDNVNILTLANVSRETSVC